MTQQWQVDGPDHAPAVVLLNAIGTTTMIWDGVAGALAERLRVIRIETRGHGESPPNGDPCTIADLGADVLAVLDELNLERTHLAGVSLGGMVGMWLAAHRPERIGRLALICTSAHLPPAQGWLDRAAAVRGDGTGAVAEPVVARWVTPALATRDPRLVARLRAMLCSVDAESYARCCEAIAAMDQRADLARIAAPTLVIAGADDLATPLPHARTIADGIAGARLEVLDGTAHIATVERAGPITARLLAHFAGGEATRRAVLGDEHVDRAAATSEFTAPFQDFITRYAWGDVWTRPDLGRRERSLVTLAVLTALGAEHEIAMHVRAALRNGIGAAEIREVLLHTAVYAGLPRANRAFAIADEVIRNRG